jgi:hypothetical protein
MRYVTGKPTGGRVGHQTTTIWYAKLFAELFGFQYVHTPLSDNPKLPYCSAASWNDFFNFGHGETPSDSLSGCGAITHWLGAYHQNDERMLAFMRYTAAGRLADAVPDQYVLQFEDLCAIHADSVRDWERQGLATAGTLRRMCDWFQQKLAASTRYRHTAAYQHPADALKVAMYWRVFVPDEYSPYIFPAPDTLAAAVSAIRDAAYPQPVSVVIFTQQQSDVREIVADYVQTIVCTEPDPQVAVGFKSLIEADVAITTVGWSSTLINIYRAFRRPTIGVPLWLIDGIALPETGAKLSLPEKFIKKC